ncbi:hypothetical protein FN846DRAFT_817657 [Sphaerosporella brunnea]|uniref:Uncharacterized protein n=1 Tax=Sphaerosporella brunnea TaxID=1250544 RepID=A0A5J5EMK2_9PEZI|nr:hypothetical protein FN846DRAFT_817657 [Sphaerosporella brunnea]
MPRPYTRYPCGIYGPRNLVRRHARRVKNRLLAETLGTVADEPPILPLGQEQLFSFYAPALEAGVYTVTVTQDINSPATKESLTLPETPNPPSKQKFEVVAPRFNLPDGAIHSSFPPQGYGALANTLPHVVLTDPHLPWDRIASAKPDSESPDWQRNQVPWLALLVFTQDELKLSADQLNGSDGLFTGTTLGKNIQQTQTFTINMKVADVPNIKNTISPITALPTEPSDDKTTDVILVPSTLFTELVRSYDDNGNPVGQTGPDVSRYKYLSHVRDINTTGMADAGVEDNGVFGIVVSHRTGPLSNTQPQPVVAHLVSIEGVESDYMNQNWPFGSAQYVAMSSLYSWNFVTLPEGSFNIETTFVNLGLGLGVLRAPDAVINGIDTSTPIGNRLKMRLEDGYTLTKYRTATGEITAAISRGPLTPTRVPYPLLPGQKASTGTTWLSNSGIDLQIMDPEVGLMDITYSVAWQLGKTLAVADQVFTTSLGKLRTAIYNGTMNNAKAEILGNRNAYKSRSETIISLTKSIPKLNALHKATPGLHGPDGSLADRWQRPQAEHLDLSYHGSLVQEIFQKHATAVGRKLMASSDGDGSDLYDEQNTPSSIDWMIVLHWVLDKMFLYNIPAHYLIVDPTYLAPETLRFFHIDRNWIDALVDGALSLGNHLAGQDKVRLAIHQMIDAYLNPESQGSPKPQVPSYGFLMHSEAVTQYPDLKVSVELTGVSEQAPILRHDNLDVTKGVMLCLLDQLPGNPGLSSVTFTQPPHQQSFIAGAELDSHHIKTLYKQIFTLKDQTPNPQPWDAHHWMRPDDPNPPVNPPPPDPSQDAGVPHATAVFKWGNAADPEVRTLLVPAWTQDVSTVLNLFGAVGHEDQPLYKDSIPNAAMAGIQLNNPIYRLVIKYGASPPSELDQGQVATVPFPATLESASHQHLSLATVSEREDSSSSYGAGKTEALPYRPHHKTPRVNSGFQLGPSHGLPVVPPPHYRPPRAPMTAPLFGTPSKNPNQIGPAGAPQYTFHCFPADNDPKNPGIPTGTGIPKDLVFTIVQVPGSVTPASSNYYLKSLTIVLELAFGPTTGSRWAHCLLSDYTGPGPFVTSNLRFNALQQIQNDPVHKLCLALRVIPRSTTGYATPDMCKEMSFILPVCRILKHDIRVKIPVWITPDYVNFAPITTVDYSVIRFPQN